QPSWRVDAKRRRSAKLHELGSVPIFRIHWRIFSQEEDVELRQREIGGREDLEVATLLSARRDGADAGPALPGQGVEMPRLERDHLVPAASALQHQRESGVVVDENLLDRVHEEADAQEIRGHALNLIPIRGQRASQAEVDGLIEHSLQVEL